jgi:hypothetical protein
MNGLRSSVGELEDPEAAVPIEAKHVLLAVKIVVVDAGSRGSATPHNGWLVALDQPTVATERTSSSQLTTPTARRQGFEWAVLGSNQ